VRIGPNVGKRWGLAACVMLAAANAEAACVFGTSFGGEPSLQAALDAILTPAPNTQTDCLQDGVGPGRDGQWFSVSPTSATILLEIAGFANQNRFGLYDALNPANRIEVFSGPNGPGTVAQLSFTPVGSGQNVSITVGGSTWTTSTPFMGSAFGFYLLTPQGNTFFSDSSLNGGLDRMYAYLGNGGVFHSGPIANDGDPSNDVFGPQDAILAYEDLVHGDNDYQDFVVLVRGVQVVPIPAAGLLLTSGLMALAAMARRRRNRPDPQ